MKLKIYRIWLYVALAVMVTPAAHAESGLYFSEFAGLSILQNAVNNRAGAAALTATYNSGYEMGASIGYELASSAERLSGVRVEEEVTYRDNALDSIAPGVVAFSAKGDVSSTSLMTNLFYKVPAYRHVHPYVGGGVGVAVTSANNISEYNVVMADDTKTAWAWQFGGGIDFDVTASTSIFIDYRYFQIESLTLVAASGASLITQYQSQNIRAGIRYFF